MGIRVGVPKETKAQEYRVGLTPASVREARAHGHEVIVERGAGLGAGVTDAEYGAVGARLVDSADEVFATTDLVVKVKEPLAAERKKLRPGQVLFTFLHLAADPEQAKELALNHVRAVNDLIDRKVKSDEADEFKKWLLAIAQRVAEASNEGGIFGFGGARVSEAEKAVLRQIAFALGQPAS